MEQMMAGLEFTMFCQLSKRFANMSVCYIEWIHIQIISNTVNSYWYAYSCVAMIY